MSTVLQRREGEANPCEKRSTLRNVLFIQTLSFIVPELEVFGECACQPVYIYLLHVNSILVTD